MIPSPPTDQQQRREELERRIRQMNRRYRDQAHEVRE